MPDLIPPRVPCWRCSIPTSQPSTLVLQQAAAGQQGPSTTRRTLCSRCCAELVAFLQSRPTTAAAK
jgi:hypothetical protein